jgi:hypothetical protein
MYDDYEKAMDDLKALFIVECPKEIKAELKSEPVNVKSKEQKETQFKEY